MANRKQLVTGHLESVSWRVFDQYPDVVRDLIRGHSGIYALFKRDRLHYVGLATNLMGRLKQHLRDRHHGAWDRFSVYLTLDDRHTKELESLLIRIASPPGNKQGARFVKSKNITLELNRRMRGADADRRARLLGGRVQRQRRKRKGAREQGSAALAGLQDRRLALRAEYKGWVYSATLRKDGRIGYGGRLFDTPTAAATAITAVGCSSTAKSIRIDLSGGLSNDSHGRLRAVTAVGSLPGGGVCQPSERPLGPPWLGRRLPDG